MTDLSTLTILKFDSYPNAIAWLDGNAGIAVRGESEYLEVIHTHILFSRLIPENQRLRLLEHFPDAIPIKLQLLTPTDHFCYCVGERRSAIVEKLKALGMTVRKAACCMEMISYEDGLDRLRELSVRTGQDPSQVPSQELGDLYRKLFPD